MNDLLELETRREIYDFITQNPGINLSKIAELLQLSPQLVDYHILYMENHGMISISKDKGYKRCYIRDKFGLADKRVLAILRQEIPFQIIFFLLNNPFSRHRDILRNLGMSSPRFSYHLRKLVKNNIIAESTVGEKKGT